MIGAILLAVSYMATVIVETSVIHAFPMPFAMFPLMLICGVLVMHRLDRTLGAAWLVTAGAFGHPWGFDVSAFLPYLAAAIAGSALTANVFTNRSVYALLGLGLSVKAVLFTTRLLEQLVLTVLNRPTLEPITLRAHLAEMLFIVIGLYVGAAIMRRVAVWGERTFFVHS